MVVSSNGAIMTTKLVTQPTGEATHTTCNKTKFNEHIKEFMCLFICVYLFICTYIYINLVSG